MTDEMSEFESVSYEQAISLLRQHANGAVALITAPFPGMSIQVSGTLHVQEGEQFAFAVLADESLSVSVMPIPGCTFQVPSPASGGVDTLICSLSGPDVDQEIMMWMVRF
jgi:hypothetical protein